jgi:putative ABC transport system substrate-binding protein
VIQRRAFLAGAAAVLAAPLAAEAQPAGKVPRIGILIPTAAPPAPQPRLDAFREALRRLGYVEGQTVLFEVRWSPVEIGRYEEPLLSLIRLPVDVIVVPSTSAAIVAKRATTTIPIVAAGAGSLVESGVVASLGRPGGNVTGLSGQSVEFSAKRVELLKEVLPSLSRVAAIEGPATDNPQTPAIEKQAETSARAVGLQYQLLRVKNPEDLDGAFRTATGSRVGAVITLPHAFFALHAARVAELALTYRLPLESSSREEVDAGALIYYGVSRSDMWRRAATYVDKILRGAKPADLPVEQPSKFELVINLKTAKALGLTIPPSVLLRADQVIE